MPWRRGRDLCAALKENGESLCFLNTGVAVPGSLGSVLTQLHRLGAAVLVLDLGNLGTGLQRAQRQVRGMGTCLPENQVLLFSD